MTGGVARFEKRLRTRGSPCKTANHRPLAGEGQWAKLRDPVLKSKNLSIEDLRI
jgi:hypothetical protein